VSQVNVLPGVLPVEIQIMRRLAKMRGARHAGVTIGHIKPTGVTCIPIGITFDGIGKWLLHRRLDAWCTRIPTVESATGRTVSSDHPDSSGRTVWRDTACGVALESTWHTNGAGCHAGKPTKLGPTVGEHWSNTCIGRDPSTALKTTMTLTVTATTTMSSESADSAPGITHIEHNGVQSLDDVVQGGMGGVLRRSKVCQLHFLVVHR
jgi:hypothetical protein